MAADWWWALSWRPIVFLGKASYAIFILHVPLLWWYLRWSREFSTALYLTIVIAVSMPVYRFIEVPANRYLRSRARGERLWRSRARYAEKKSSPPRSRAQVSPSPTE